MFYNLYDSSPGLSKVLAGGGLPSLRSTGGKSAQFALLYCHVAKKKDVKELQIPESCHPNTFLLLKFPCPLYRTPCGLPNLRQPTE